MVVDELHEGVKGNNSQAFLMAIIKRVLKCWPITQILERFGVGIVSKGVSYM